MSASRNPGIYDLNPVIPGYFQSLSTGHQEDLGVVSRNFQLLSRGQKKSIAFPN